MRRLPRISHGGCAMADPICEKCGSQMVWDELQWTCIECIRRMVGPHGHFGQPVTNSWSPSRHWFYGHHEGRHTFPIRTDDRTNP